MSRIAKLIPIRMRLPCIARRLLADESGQDILEYVLVGAAFAVAIAGVLIVGFGALVPEVLDSLCDTVDPLGGGNCLP
jgi:Flp pilus assembly pilin Flp